MLKNVTTFLFLLMACVCMGQANSAQQVFSGEISDSVCSKEGSHDAMMKKSGVNTTVKCTIGCAMTRGKYVLYNRTTKQIYQLDDQERPQEFAGQKVRVRGSLDA